MTAVAVGLQPIAIITMSVDIPLITLCSLWDSLPQGCFQVPHVSLAALFDVLHA